jgi:hypothetical protein
MLSTATTAAVSSPDAIFRGVRAVLGAGLICGILDGTCALIFSGVKWTILFQFIASGILGPNAFKGGVLVAMMGVGLHFLIALTATAVFYTASRVLPVLLEHALPFGVLYGILVHLFMQFVVLPASAIGRRPFSARGFLTQLIIHMVLVGPTIALSLRRLSR